MESLPRLRKIFGNFRLPRGNFRECYSTTWSRFTQQHNIPHNPHIYRISWKRNNSNTSSGHYLANSAHLPRSTTSLHTTPFRCAGQSHPIGILNLTRLEIDQFPLLHCITPKMTTRRPWDCRTNPNIDPWYPHCTLNISSNWQKMRQRRKLNRQNCMNILLYNMNKSRVTQSLGSINNRGTGTRTPLTRRNYGRKNVWMRWAIPGSSCLWS